MPENICANQLKCKNFLLGHPVPRLFVTSQWRWPPIIYVIYRIVVALYFVTWIILSGALDPDADPAQGFKWFLYLTNWTYLMLTVNTIILAITASVSYFRKQTTVSSNENQPELKLPWYLKVQWIIFNIATAGSLTVTIGYWGLLWRPGVSVGHVGINTHAINSVYVLFDFFIIAIPIRLLHFWHPLVYGLFYILFTVIFQAAGGTDPAGRPYIYYVLDFFGKPGLAFFTTGMGIFVGLPLLWFLIFCMYFLRVFLNKLQCCICSTYRGESFDLESSSQAPQNVEPNRGLSPVAHGKYGHDNRESNFQPVKERNGTGSVNAAFEE